MTPPVGSQPWWERVPAKTKAMAIALCEAGSPCGVAEWLVCPHPEMHKVLTPRGWLAAVRPEDLVPLWTVYLRLADTALKTEAAGAGVTEITE
jgi:hypothetical protein